MCCPRVLIYESEHRPPRGRGQPAWLLISSHHARQSRLRGNIGRQRSKRTHVNFNHMSRADTSVASVLQSCVDSNVFLRAMLSRGWRSPFCFATLACPGLPSCTQLERRVEATISMLSFLQEASSSADDADERSDSIERCAAVARCATLRPNSRFVSSSLARSNSTCARSSSVLPLLRSATGGGSVALWTSICTPPDELLECSAV